MSKITLEQLMELHGLEDGDEFVVRGLGNKYKVVSNNLMWFNKTNKCWQGSSRELKFLLTEELTITNKAPWAPKKGEGYYGLYTVVDAFSNTGLDTAQQMLFDCGCIFKSNDEAEARRQELIKWLKESAK